MAWGLSLLLMGKLARLEGLRCYLLLQRGSAMLTFNMEILPVVCTSCGRRNASRKFRNHTETPPQFAEPECSHPTTRVLFSVHSIAIPENARDF